MGEPIRVLIADDDRLVRAGIGLVLAPLDDVEVVAEASNGAEAVDSARRHRIDVALLDVRMPVMDGLTALRELRITSPDTCVIVLTTFGEDEYVAEALIGGATGFVLKDSAVEELPRAIRAVAAGDAFLSPAVTRQVLTHLPTAPPSSTTQAAATVATLSDRERDVLVLLAQGMSNAEIGASLFISEGTVKTHIYRMFTKTDCVNRVQAAMLAHRAGLLS